MLRNLVKREWGKMSLETKILIISMAEFARLAKNRQMYEYAKALGQAENLTLTPYEDEPAE